MIEIIHSSDRDQLEAMMQRLRDRNVVFDEDLITQVATIINNVRTRGDAALIEYAARFDKCELTTDQLRISHETLTKSAERTPPAVLAALRLAIRRVRAFHQFERCQSWEFETADGSRLGQRITSIDSAGLYVPGGTASYPSSVVMNVVPAQIAGVPRIAIATPPGTIQQSPAVAAAILELGITEVYAIGGAQAIAALAYGTEAVARVDKITGPGNRYVAAAKKLVFGTVGIDSIAGPSEVVIVADGSADPSYIASDLLAQAEHGEDASALLITDSEVLARGVKNAIIEQVQSLPRARLIEQALSQFGAIVVVDDLDVACALANRLAPEHVQIIAREDESLAARIRNAGAIFLGEQTPVAAGDYLAGPNHVLPTAAAARFSSALDVSDFFKRTSMLRLSSQDLNQNAASIAALAQAEGLDAHARSALIRLQQSNPKAPADDTRRTGLNAVKTRVRDLRAYSLRQRTTKVKLNQNENPWDAPTELKLETLRRLSERAWSRYPEFVPAGLHSQLAQFSGWSPDGVLAGNGSNELIQALLMVTIERGKRVLINEPTFALYRQITTVLGGEVLTLPLTRSLTYDVGALNDAVESLAPDVIIICSPNNPTGCVLDLKDLETLLESTRGLVVVDEAYFEFSGQTAVPLLKDHANLAVLRTFSKAMALAGLRVGYLLAEPELVQNISKALLPYNLNIMSRIAAEVAIELYESQLQPLIRAIREERDRLYAALKSIDGLFPVTSRANFMLVRTQMQPQLVFNELLKRDILVRDVSSYPMLSDYFRISIGTPEENDLLIKALHEISSA